ncbi:MAG: NAD-dependent epimerase/dehydratase family protein, partial [Candidatus Rokubacteria bacterium]|nr:NAD-dependent epimerase/dehydratase family protein [Candidatus Rokubacteria bacterium]
MARKPVVLVTGASGEMGHGLIHRLAELGTFDVLALDLRPLDPELARRCAATRVGGILDRHLLDRLMSEFEISVVFHLAHAEPAPAGGRGGAVARPRGYVPLPQLHRSLRASDPGRQAGGGPGCRARVAGAGDHVRLQQALLRAPGPLLRPPL